LRGPLKGVVLDLDLEHDTQILLGLYEIEIQRHFVDLATSARVLIDVGAAEGMYTAFFLAKTAAPTVIACEPDPARRAGLLRTLASNHWEHDPRLKVVPASLGAPGTADTLDELLDRNPGPAFVKLDVDGGELDVIRGAERSILNRTSTWLVETHSLELEESCMGYFANVGYRTGLIPNAGWRWLLPEQRPIAHNRWFWAAP